MSYYEPFIKRGYKEGCKTIFPFSHLLERYAPLMKVIMNYFTYEGLCSRLYSYHVRLLMHFTRLNMLNFPPLLDQDGGATSAGEKRHTLGGVHSS